MKQVIFVLLLLIPAVVFAQDLVITNHNIPITFPSRETFPAEVTVQNVGTLPVENEFSIMLYLSVDDKFEPPFIDRGIEYDFGFVTTPVAPGQSMTVRFDKGYFDVPPGTYNMFIQVNPYEEVTETDRDNNLIMIPNIAVIPGSVDFELTTFNILAPPAQTQNTYLFLDYGFKNVGPVKPDDYDFIKTTFVLSTDAVYSNDDLEIVTPSTRFRGRTEVYESSEVYVLPTAPPGDYYILAFVNPQGTNRYMHENNIDNNTIAIPFTITPANVDLEVTSVSSVEYNSHLYTTFHIRNHGLDGVGRYEIKLELIDPSGNKPPGYIYLEKKDLEFAFNDFVFGNSEQDVGISSSVSIEPGFYYLRISVNPDCSIPETDCSNNSFIAEAYPIIVGSPIVSHVRLNRLTPDVSVNDTDENLALSLNLTNSGTTTNFEQHYTIIVKDSQGGTVHTAEVTLPIDFAPGQTVDRSVALNLSHPLPVGAYTVSLSCLGDCNTFLLPSTANFTVVAAEFLLTGTVNGGDGVPINKGSLFLYQDNGAGEVGVVQKVISYGGPTFSFTVDGKKSHTLYFVPDPTLYPDYVPTIYGKTVTLQPDNFFRAQENMNVTLEVIKMQSLGTGTGIINGFVRAGNASSKVASPLASVEGTSVILMSASGEVVGITQTDASGFYEFKGLPRDSYQVVLRPELDQVQMLPYAVDITGQNVRLDLNTLATGIEPEPSQLFLSQQITFAELGSRSYGSANITLDAKSDQTLPVKYTTSDAEVATIVNNEVVIHNTGTVIITAGQEGNAFYLPARATQTLVVTQASQSISFDALKVQSVDVGSLSLSGTTSSGLEVSFESSDDAIVSIEGKVAVLHKPGEVTITAHQAGNRNYLAADAVTRNLVVYNVLGIEPIDLAKYAHPNPTSDLVFLEIPLLGQVAVFDALGKERHDVTRVDNILDFSRAEAGVYLIRITLDNRSAMARIIKK